MKKNIYLFIFLFVVNSYSQEEKDNDYFVFYKGGEKHLKPVKYVFFNVELHQKIVAKSDIFFHFENEEFKFSKNTHKMDSCHVSYLRKINFSNVNELSNEEFEFYQNEIDKENYWKGKMPKPPIPINTLHQFFKVFVLERHKDILLKYEVDWTYTSKRGLKLRD